MPIYINWVLILIRYENFTLLNLIMIELKTDIWRNNEMHHRLDTVATSLLALH